jgi:hypothetical protein
VNTIVFGSTGFAEQRANKDCLLPEKQKLEIIPIFQVGGEAGLEPAKP